MLRIRLARRGKRHQPTYRVVVIERHRATDGKYVDDVGSYDPHNRDYRLNLEKIQYWISKGAKPTDSVASLIESAGKDSEGQRARRDGFTKKNKKQKKAEEEAKAAAEKEAAAKAEEKPSEEGGDAPAEAEKPADDVSKDAPKEEEAKKE